MLHYPSVFVVLAILFLRAFLDGAPYAAAAISNFPASLVAPLLSVVPVEALGVSEFHDRHPWIEGQKMWLVVLKLDPWAPAWRPRDGSLWAHYQAQA